MQLSTILLFFICTWGFGFTASSFVKNSENFLERNLIRIGIGLGIFVVLGVLLNLLRIPLDWKIFLVLSLVYPLFILFKKIKSKELKLPKFKLTKSNLNILIVLVIFFVCLQMYAGGSFKYPHLEDDDPWSYATSVKYIAVEKTAYSPSARFIYLDPYPPGYSLLLGVLHQTNNSIYFTLKFFNGLIISLGIILFYFFAKTFTASRNKALFSTFVLAALPSFFTHFIWAHSLVIMLFFPAIYCLEMIKNDKKWKYPAAILIASILLTQPSQALKLGIIFGIYFIIKSLYEKKFLKDIFYAEVGGLLLSFLWWFNKASPFLSTQIGKATTTTKSKYVELISSIDPSSFLGKLKAMFPPQSGTATRVLSLNDFLIAKPFGGINVQVGWGIFISLLVVIGLIYLIIRYREAFKKENAWIGITLVWFLFTFLGTNAMTFNLPIGFITFRFWLLLAIPIALISSIGLWSLFRIGKRFSIPKLIIILIIITGILFTSGYQKYNHNTLPTWPPGAEWTSTEELEGYLWLKTLPPNTQVFTYSTNDKHVIGLDKYSCQWCNSVIKFRENILDKDVDELYSFLKNTKYEYLVISGMSYKYLGREFGEEEAKESIDILLEKIQNSAKFTIAHQTKGAVIFKVN